ncbi:type VI protein secretion system component VasK [Variovorax boronicumulans]|uniref:type VI secretion system protein n=1 Tax=Variovorax boronicumulans TaxID=436515 RepID=UPI0024760096|nr:type VI secretion system protein [Variovorax boronicumulans]MDH6170724.1 type VI protein secretion system component VasK [Variovorax boronicumulans]
MTALISPVHLFWALLALCLLGFGMLYAMVHDAGRGARRRALLRRIETLDAPVDNAAVDALRESMALARQALRQAPRPARASHGPVAPAPWFLFLGDAAADLPGLLATAQGERLALPDSQADDPNCWRWWLTGALAAIEVQPAAVGETAAAPRTRGLWLQALLALAERRDRLPLNGVVVCFSASELLQADAEDLRPLAARMRRLLDEAGDTLRLQLPTYLVVTGLEHLTGYATLRGALPPEVLAQALGHRLPDPFAASNASAGDRLDALFDPIAAQLHALRMALLREQHGAAARLSIHGFVEAVQGLQPALREVAEVLFEAHGRGGRAPRWRGLYFTAAASDASGGAFVTDLFERFLPADQPLVRPGRPSSHTAAGAP